MINKHKSNKIKENSNTVRHLNNGTDHRHSKSCCDQSSPARRTMRIPNTEKYRDEMVVRPSYLYNGNSYTGETSLYQIGSLLLKFSSVVDSSILWIYLKSFLKFVKMNILVIWWFEKITPIKYMDIEVYLILSYCHDWLRYKHNDWTTQIDVEFMQAWIS